jgi:hypothetical protein
MEEPMSDPTSSRPRLSAPVIALILVVLALAGYAYHEHSSVNSLAAQNEKVTASLTDTRSQIDALSAKINTLSAPPPVQAQPVQLAHTGKSKAKTNAARRIRRDDPRWKQFQAKLDEQAKALGETREGLDATRKGLDDTRNDLAGTRTELSGSIARTHDELVVLQRKGERSYYEFNLDKGKQFTHTGPFGIRVKKANTKNQYADLELMVDDAKVTKKHVNIFEPVMFYAGDSGQPAELVINSISKNHIKGYVSEPKYRRSDLTAMSSAASSANTNNSATAGSSDAPPAPRRKLEFPKN